MLILIPIFFLLSGAIAIIFIQWLRPSFGLSWLLASTAALLAWLSLIVLRLRLPLNLVVIPWQSQALFSASPTLLMDRFSWPYATGLAVLVLAVILTASASSQDSTNPFTWAGSLAVASAGLVAIFAGNPLTLLMAWAAVDLVELFILQGSVRPEERRDSSVDEGTALEISGSSLNQRIVLAYSSRTMGVLLIFLGMVLGGLEANTYSLKHISLQAGLLILIGIGLRLGVLPLHLPFSQEPRLRRGLGTILRLVPVVSTLVLLARLPGELNPEAWSPWLLGLVTLAGLYGGAMWLASVDELNGRPYWMLGWAALAVTSTLRGSPVSTVAWGIACLLPGSFLFLYSARERSRLYLPVLAIWGIIGLPFSPAASGWDGLFGSGIDGYSVLGYLGLIFLLIGFLRHAFRQTEPLAKDDRWVQIVYPVGLFLIILTDAVLGGWGWPGSLTSAYWWAGIVPVVICCLTFLIQRQGVIPSLTSDFFASNWIVLIIKNFLLRLSAITRLEWFYRLLGDAYATICRLLDGLTAILEGDGGLLWALLILSLLVSLITLAGS